MPASRITLLQRSVSSRLSFAMSCGLPPPALSWRSEPRLGCRLVEDFVDRAVEFRNDRGRRLGRRADGIPGVREEARYAEFDQRRNVRQDIEPVVGRDRENSGLA